MGVRFLSSLLVVFLISFNSLANNFEIKPSAPEIYVVKPGDTLWDIASLYLQQPWLWPELWRNNVHVVNPHLIYPGDKLSLRPNKHGEVVLDIVRANKKDKIKLTPRGVKHLKKASAVELLPWTIIQPYIENSLIVTEQEYEALPQLLGDDSGSVMFVEAANVLTATPSIPNELWWVVRKQNQIIDSEKQLLGVQLRHVADAHLTPSQPENAQMVALSHSKLEARQGDKLIARPAPHQPQMSLQAADQQRGYIVDNPEQRLLLGKFDVVVVNLGRDQVKPGMVLGIYAQGPDIFDGDPPIYDEDVNLIGQWSVGGERLMQPALKMGELVVFRTFEKASYALITRANKTIRKGEIVARP